MIFIMIVCFEQEGEENEEIKRMKDTERTGQGFAEIKEIHHVRKNEMFEARNKGQRKKENRSKVTRKGKGYMRE
jgi:hypothetical protein